MAFFKKLTFAVDFEKTGSVQFFLYFGFCPIFSVLFPSIMMVW